MTTLSGSLLVLAGALMFGSAKLAQAIALSAGWRDTPVSMLVIGSVFCLGGLMVLIRGLRRDEGHLKMLSGSVLVVAAAVVFGSGKIAMSVAASTGTREVPIQLLVIGSSLSLGGSALLIWGLVRDQDRRRAPWTIPGQSQPPDDRKSGLQAGAQQSAAPPPAS